MQNRLSLPALLRSATLAFIVTASFAVQADKSDFKQTIQILSENNAADGIQKSGYYSGNVHITQGSLVIDADEVFIDAKDGPGNEVFIAKGKPASYQQKANDGSMIKAVADEIRYTLNNRVLTLSDNAELHLQSSMVKAERIEFDMENEQFNAKGSDNEDGRTITIYQPSTQEDANGNP